MRIVLDTNILIRANAKAKGPARELLLLIVNSPEHLLLLSPFLVQELERVFKYGRVQAATKLTDVEVAEYLSYIRAREVSEMVFPGPAPRIVPSHAEDDPVVHTAVVGQAEILCTLNRDYYHASVLEYCKERGVLVGSDVAVLDLLRRRRSG
jgi:putative PIN family toxin of toxin-antitoxin system